jgi:GTP-binding protein LepA
MLTVSPPPLCGVKQINGEEATPLATIVHRDKSYSIGKAMTEKLKELIPRQLFKIPIQVSHS